MTGPEHYREAERMIALVDDGAADWEPPAASAGVHAALALAAATVDVALMHPEDRAAWDRATGRLEATP